MSTAVTFQNKGLIDLRALKTFGVSAKESANAIGYFGTGLKYALAILLREGCEVAVYRGRKKYSFTSKETKIRGETFNLVHMNGQALGFTTALGKDWELWQAFRELWCNTIDEGGDVGKLATKGEAGATTVVVKGEAFDEVYERRHTVILLDEPDLRLDGVEVHYKPSEYLYYRGIRVLKLRHPSAMTYNVTRTISLTEDRTVRFSWEPLNIIKNAITKSTDVAFLEKILTAGQGQYEHSFDFDDLSQNPGTTFVTTADDLRGSKTVNKSAVKIAREALRKELEAHQGQKLEGAPAEQLAYATKFCEDLGLPLNNYAVIVVDGLDDGKTWVREGTKIFLAPEIFIRGNRELITGLIKAVIQDDPYSEGTLINRLIAAGEKAQGGPLA